MLPGLDTDLDDEAWQTIGGVRDAQGKFTTQPSSNHPQFAMHGLLDRFGIKRERRRDPGHAGAAWARRAGVGDDAALDRDRTMARPAGAAGCLAKIAGGMTNLAVVEAPNSEMEALAIAVAMREARHLDKSAALVTPDRALARRVMAALEPLESRIRRFRRRRADGHAGRHFRPPRRGSRSQGAGAADAAGAAEASAVSARRRAWRAASAPSKCSNWRCLRGTRPQAGTGGLARDFDRFRAELGKLGAQETSSLHASEPRARLKDDELDQAQSLIAALQKALSPLESVASSKPYDFAELAHRHREVLIALSSRSERRCRRLRGQSGIGAISGVRRSARPSKSRAA